MCWIRMYQDDIAGNAIVPNASTDPVYLWSIGSPARERQTVKSSSKDTNTERDDKVLGGIAIKITRTENGLYNGSLQTHFHYALTNHLDYGLLDVFDNPFSRSTRVVHPFIDTCNSICWGGSFRATATSQTEACGTGADTVVTLRTESCWRGNS
ncbi:Antigenic thaumatin-like protein [Penicillium rolfsii]|nr:Antigenic thaumatin-like protein [Penicillium rolfsii]